MRPTFALVAGLAAWPFVVSSAGFTMADNRPATVVALACAAVLALLGMSLTVATVRRTPDSPVSLTVASLGFLLATSAGIVALVFALAFRL
jgi:hypothetical protein